MDLSKIFAQRLSPRILVFGSLIAQSIAFYALWSHLSDEPQILGRYSISYTLFLGISLLIGIIWISIAFRQTLFIQRIERLNISIYRLLLIILLLVGCGIWFIPIEHVIKEFMALNSYLVTIILVQSRSEGLYNVGKKWLLFVAIGCTLLVTVMLITILNNQKFSPDEAHWADYATSLYRVGGVYSRTWLQQPMQILPGIGWSVPAYGALLEKVKFDIRVGRLWIFAVNILTISGIFAISWRLYGKKAAVFSGIFALLSQNFVPIFDFRPDYQLSVAAVVIVFAAVQARQMNTHKHWLWNILCGLAATLSLELHAAGVVFAIGLTILYLGETLVSIYRQRKWQILIPILSFGVGAISGTTIYYLANVQAIGGIQPYLQSLISERVNTPFHAPLLAWPSLLEWVLIVASFAYMIWRRNASDRLYIRIWGCIMLGVLVLYNQPYFSHFRPLYVIPVGVLLVDGLSNRTIQRGQNLHLLWAGTSLFCILAATQMGDFISWQSVMSTLKTGDFKPTLYEELRPLIASDIHPTDIVVSTHMLIWTFPQYEHLVSFAAEETAMQRWQLENAELVWENVHPTVVVYLDNQMIINPGLERYMTLHRFQTCRDFQLRQTHIFIYRAQCVS